MQPPRRSSDPFDLARFVWAQEGTYEHAVRELRSGRKRSHWMWFVFPQLAGLGHGPVARRYAIRSLAEARAYLAHPLLGPRLLECTRILNGLQGLSAHQVFGNPDDLKLGSSMTLFELVAGSDSDFSTVLNRYFGGRRDALTARLLETGNGG